MTIQRSEPEMAWNVFKFCTALRALGSIMIVFVLGIICLTYYAVVLVDFGPALFLGGLDSLTAFAVLLLFHFLLVMLLWSYFAVVLTDPGGVPPNWKPAIDEETGDTDPLVGSEYNREGLNLNQLTMLGDPANERIRFCRKCNQYKPPRCHHCSVFLNLAFSLSVMGFMIMHLSLVAANTTTIEAYEKKTSPKWQYDLGRKKNFQQVFGLDKRYWFIPAYSDDDLRRNPALQGLEYPTKPELNALQHF
ncbi:hypothetical protein FEM48_Zijuj11G0051800 [Ziziphus jujuba var. spinosa]|uniref:Uncharacterized protein n=1 Tax=Ziziphus jujuba var. spinosa TaxID=714518 RepID=A0A978UH10_ZIZJJ|nr:hypothetical protein FEM48_Zijuj11G0051800 [Ziziphus jujuba var. spinosa]